MSSSGYANQINVGDDVYGSDGDKVGTVAEVQQDYIVVEKGFFFPTDYYIPMSAVASYDDGRVYLSVTKDQALNQGWGSEPTDVDDYDGPPSYVADASTTTATATTDAIAGTGAADHVLLD